MTHRNLFKRIGIFLTIGIMVFAGQPVFADDENFYVQNNILYYGSEAAVCSTSLSGGTPVTGTDNISKMWNYFVAKGLNGQQAAGILGNIQMESGFSPTRQETSQAGTQRGGWGIVQWTGSRRVQLREYIAENDSSLLKYESNTALYGTATGASLGYRHVNVPEEDNDKLLSLELDFLYAEASSRVVSGLANTTETHQYIRDAYGGRTEWEALKSATSLKDASNIWLLAFERPRVQSISHQESRTRFGQDIYDRLGGIGDGEEVNTDAVTEALYSCDDPIQKDFVGTTVDYVLPDWHEPLYTGATNARPAYVAAANKAERDGLYVGDGGRPSYADCGGFVTLLIRNSGFDTSYNYDGRGGPTSTQQQWLDDNWQNLGNAGTIDIGTLQPGDVFIRDGHTFIYIGDVEGIDSNIASASQNERVPMAGIESLVDERGNWYRKGNINEQSI